MNLKQYFTSEYLFQINNAFVSPAEKLFFFGSLILILLAVVTKIAVKLAPSPVDAKYRQKFYSLFLTAGIWELLWYFFRYENVKFFGSHFMAWLGILVAIVWFIKILIAAFKNYSKEKSVWGKEQVRMKYLPQ